MDSESLGGVGGLSPRGMARRGSMLAELDGVMRRRNARRVAGRVAVGVAPLLLVAAVIWGRGVGAPNKPRPSGESPVARGPEVVGVPASMVQIVQTDAGILSRITMLTGEPRVTLISDSELQTLLASQGKPTGFVRTGGRMILVTDFTPRETKDAPDRDDPGASS